MATDKSTIEYILNQLSTLDNVNARKMFGEYALYYDRKVVGLVCDDTLFIKITDLGKKFVDHNYQEGYAYKGAKPSMLINEELIENSEWLCQLIRITANSLPIPKTKKGI